MFGKIYLNVGIALFLLLMAQSELELVRVNLKKLR